MKNYIQGIDHVQVAAPVGCEEERVIFMGIRLVWKKFQSQKS